MNTKNAIQSSLFPHPSTLSPNSFPGIIVNVASVPQRSLFRYPGGKTWFVPTFRKWIGAKQNCHHKVLFEPFAGGGIIGLTAAFENMVCKVVLTEIDDQIASVWETVLDGDGAKWLAQKIMDFDLTQENLLIELDKKRTSVRELAFQTILRNRTLHGGILANGSSFMKIGEKGKGLLSRWYPFTLAKRIFSILSIANKIKFARGDGIKTIQKNLKGENNLFFIDPPYTAGGKKAGRRLYVHSEIDHGKLFSLCEKIEGDFIMTYDNSAEVHFLANKHGFAYKPVAMKSTHHAQMTELVISKKLAWLEDIQII